MTVGQDVRLQIGEPWWWVNLDAGRTPHFYDPVTTALYETESGHSLPVRHVSATEVPTPDQQLYLDWLGDKLGQSTVYIRDAVKAAFPAAKVGLLFYVPQVMVEEAPMLQTVNYLSDHWQFPAFDFFQIEDYDFVIDGHWKRHRLALDQIVEDLAYDLADMHYFAGFNLLPETTEFWCNIDQAAGDAFYPEFWRNIRLGLPPGGAGRLCL